MTTLTDPPMTDWYEKLADAQEARGHTTHRIVAGDGRLLVTERGARVLACTLPDAPDNLFFHHRNMLDPDKAGTPFGGDRLWIAPEIGWFWPSIDKARENPAKYAATPPQIDPGNYQTDSASPVHAQLSNRLKLTDVRDGKSIELAVSRQVRAINKPADLPQTLSCVSFAITNVLLNRGGDDGAVAGAWDILQVPPTGTLICPTASPVKTPRSYYEPFGDRHVECDEHAVHFLIDSDRRVKMGLTAEQTTGRMGYYRPLGDGKASLILRIFPTLPGEPYCDLPIDNDESERVGGDCLQAYNHNDTGASAFGEMEYHDPAVIVANGPASRHGTCVTHALVGPDADIQTFGRQLLGAPIRAIE